MSPQYRVPIIDTHLLFHLTDGLPPRMLVIFIDREGYDMSFCLTCIRFLWKKCDFGHIPGLDRLLGQEHTHTATNGGEQTIRMWPQMSPIIDKYLCFISLTSCHIECLCYCNFHWSAGLFSAMFMYFWPYTHEFYREKVVILDTYLVDRLLGKEDACPATNGGEQTARMWFQWSIGASLLIL